MVISNLSKFRLLLWKNYVLQKRQKLQTVLEIVLPLVFVAVLVLTRDLIESTKHENGETFPAFHPTDIKDTVIFDNLVAQVQPFVDDNASGKPP